MGNYKHGLVVRTPAQVARKCLGTYLQLGAKCLVSLLDLVLAAMQNMPW